jgi:hypothetical protein
VIIGVVVHLPLIAYSLYFAESLEASPGDDGRYLRHNLISLGLGFLLTPIQTGAVTFGVFQHLRGQRASLGDCLSAGFSRMLPVIGVALSSGIIILVGYVLLIIPGIIFNCMLYISVPAAVVERGGVLESLGRSRLLTRNNRLQIFGLLFLMGIIGAAINAALRIAFLVGGRGSGLTTYMAATLFVNIVIGIWHSSAACITYYHLRSMKESVDIEEVASVFD